LAAELHYDIVKFMLRVDVQLKVGSRGGIDDLIRERVNILARLVLQTVYLCLSISGGVRSDIKRRVSEDVIERPILQHKHKDVLDEVLMLHSPCETAMDQTAKREWSIWAADEL
jgi:hypothetical protein